MKTNPSSLHSKINSPFKDYKDTMTGRKEAVPRTQWVGMNKDVVFVKNGEVVSATLRGNLIRRTGYVEFDSVFNDHDDFVKINGSAHRVKIVVTDEPLIDGEIDSNTKIGKNTYRMVVRLRPS